MKTERIALDTSILIEMCTVGGTTDRWRQCRRLLDEHRAALFIPLPTAQEFIAGTPPEEMDRRKAFLELFKDARVTDRSLAIIERIAREHSALLYAATDSDAEKQAIKWDVAIIACAIENGMSLCTGDKDQRDLYRLIADSNRKAGFPSIFLGSQEAFPF